jgi:predicted nuclease of restriction endonuclease-like (RecB) superfamily
MKKKISKIKKSSASKEYINFLTHIKNDILQTQLKAALSVTKELILLYWRIGKELSERMKTDGWGAKVIETLANDLKSNFPGMTGFSLRNLRYMRTFAEIYPDLNVATAVATLPWGHNLVLIEKLQDNEQRLWYAQQALGNGWSRAVLTMWIESDLFKRQGKAITNFKKTIVSPDSDIAQQTLKDPYNFGFLMMDKQARERDIEQGLMSHLQKFLLELGQGFAFVGRQYQLTVGNKDIFIDMLFYHVKLRRYIVIELKAEEFDERNLGQINLYLSAVDDLLRHSDDQPSIGLLLCKSKNNYLVEYALRDINKPIGISSYTTKLVESLPKNLKSSLPTIQELEAELEKAEMINKPKVEIKIKPKKSSAKKSPKKVR